MHLKEGILLQGGKYRIVRFISSGGFGCTYEAEHVMFRKRVAIKEFFVKDFCGRDENTALVTVETTNKRGLIDKMKLKFIDEARSLFDLHHQGIVRVTDIFEENNTAYYVMDYIDGKSLKEIVDKEGALSEVRALGYIRQVADALGYVHAHNRLHLDIKPSNIMIDGNDHAILIDFGTSKQYDEVNGENTSTLLGHTPGYAPPEQIGNDLVTFTPTTDIYALGATLYKLLSGITPTSSNLRISGEKMEPLSGSISAPTCNTVERAMKLNRYNRPDSIDAFLSLLFAPVSVLDEDDENTVIDGGVLPTPVSGPKPSLNPRKWLIPLLLLWVTALCTLGLRECLDFNDGGSEDNDSLKLENLAHKDSINAFVPKTPPLPALNDSFIGQSVDLGLSVEWATVNVGALSVEDYGDVYAWGELSIKKEYTPSNYKWFEPQIPPPNDYVHVADRYDFVAKKNNHYVVKKYNHIDKKNELDSSDDVTTVKWGNDWYIPTYKDWNELRQNCRWLWCITKNGAVGYEITSKINGNRIFLPASSVDSVGHYWSSTLDTTNSSYDLAQSVDFNSKTKRIYHELGFREEGHAVRPVKKHRKVIQRLR